MFFKDVKQYCFVRLCESDYVICWSTFVLLLCSLILQLCLIFWYVMGASLLLIGLGFAYSVLNICHALNCFVIMFNYYNVWRHSGHYDHPPAQPVGRPAYHYVFSNSELERISFLTFNFV